MLTRIDELREPVALDTQLSLRPPCALNYYNHLRPVEGLASARTRLPVPGLRATMIDALSGPWRDQGQHRPGRAEGLVDRARRHQGTNLRAVSTGQLMGADPGSPAQVGAVLPPRDVSIRLVQDRRIEDLIDTWCGRVRYPKPPTTSQAVAARVA
jgi:hypothetical protein